MLSGTATINLPFRVKPYMVICQPNLDRSAIYIEPKREATVNYESNGQYSTDTMDGYQFYL
jgi:hypothetical protein